jgi:hypothetical protein
MCVEGFDEKDEISVHSSSKKKRSSSRYKNHAHAFLSVRLQLSVFCAHSQTTTTTTTTTTTEKTREEEGLRRLSALSLVAATQKRSPAFLSFFLFFPHFRRIIIFRAQTRRRPRVRI